MDTPRAIYQLDDNFECFIEIGKFNSYEEVFEKVSNIDNFELQNYLQYESSVDMVIYILNLLWKHYKIIRPDMFESEIILIKYYLQRRCLCNT